MTQDQIHIITEHLRAKSALSLISLFDPNQFIIDRTSRSVSAVKINLKRRGWAATEAKPEVASFWYRAMTLDEGEVFAYNHCRTIGRDWGVTMYGGIAPSVGYVKQYITGSNDGCIAEYALYQGDNPFSLNQAVNSIGIQSGGLKGEDGTMSYGLGDQSGLKLNPLVKGVEPKKLRDYFYQWLRNMKSNPMGSSIGQRYTMDASIVYIVLNIESQEALDNFI